MGLCAEHKTFIVRDDLEALCLYLEKEYSVVIPVVDGFRATYVETSERGGDWIEIAGCEVGYIAEVVSQEKLTGTSGDRGYVQAVYALNVAKRDLAIAEWIMYTE